MQKIRDMKARVHDTCVIFDCNGTLVHKPGTARIILSYLGINGKKSMSLRRITGALRTMYERRKFRHPRFASESDRENFYVTYNKELCALLGITISDEQARNLNRALKKARWKLYPDVLPVLKHFAKKKIPMGVIANWTATLAAVLREVGIEDYFDFVYSSHELGIDKPNPEIFTKALKRERKKYTRLYYVGDDYDLDVVSARAAGLTPVLIDHGNSSIAEKGLKKIKTLSGLRTVIE